MSNEEALQIILNLAKSVKSEIRATEKEHGQINEALSVLEASLKPKEEAAPAV